MSEKTMEKLVRENKSLREQVSFADLEIERLKEEIRRLEKRLVSQKDEATVNNILAQMAAESGTAEIYNMGVEDERKRHR